MINSFEIAGDFFLRRFIDFLFHSIDDFFHLHLFLYGAVEPIDAGDV